MGCRASARGPFCFLVGPLRSDMRRDASLCREAFSPSLVRMHVGSSVLQLRFLVTPCLAGVCVAALAAGWRVLVKPSNMLALSELPAVCARLVPLAWQVYLSVMDAHSK